MTFDHRRSSCRDTVDVYHAGCFHYSGLDGLVRWCSSSPRSSSMTTAPTGAGGSGPLVPPLVTLDGLTFDDQSRFTNVTPELLRSAQVQMRQAAAAIAHGKASGTDIGDLMPELLALATSVPIVFASATPMELLPTEEVRRFNAGQMKLKAERDQLAAERDKLAKDLEAARELVQSLTSNASGGEVGTKRGRAEGDEASAPQGYRYIAEDWTETSVPKGHIFFAIKAFLLRHVRWATKLGFHEPHLVFLPCEATSNLIAGTNLADVVLGLGDQMMARANTWRAHHQRAVMLQMSGYKTGLATSVTVVEEKYVVVIKSSSFLPAIIEAFAMCVKAQLSLADTMSLKKELGILHWYALTEPGMFPSLIRTSDVSMVDSQLNAVIVGQLTANSSQRGVTNTTSWTLGLEVVNAHMQGGSVVPAYLPAAVSASPAPPPASVVSWAATDPGPSVSVVGSPTSTRRPAASAANSTQRTAARTASTAPPAPAVTMCCGCGAVGHDDPNCPSTHPQLLSLFTAKNLDMTAANTVFTERNLRGTLWEQTTEKSRIQWLEKRLGKQRQIAAVVKTVFANP